ncbi:DEAD/DEAH box helicase [Algoriphagus sediminis]|uniref:AAA domain-containing protein n=1 Tax=Algoriphagus sediminis TaxID=3057113 RepID=A0ABT7YGJ9_9BACT|nr:AAA domain-containing protein [Algoriphagus sediminis]MDN3205652.1 AAA domain-containing protein [Algoriphagus sediminis]
MSVLSEFKQAIAIQQSKENEAFEEQMSLPVDERVAKGITMTNLRVEFDFFEYPPNDWCPYIEAPQKFIRSARIFTDNNISKFREGGQVILSNGAKTFKMDIMVDTIDEFILAPNDFDVKFCYIDSRNYNPNNWEINIRKTDLTLKLLTATAGNLESDSVRLSKIETFMAGNLQNRAVSNLEFSGLNSSQNRAINNSLNSENFHLIQGPPGTGKTTTIAHIAKILVDAGKKVFVTAPTHTAINNSLNAISSVIQDSSKVVKIGEKYQAAEILDNGYVTRMTRLTRGSYETSFELSQEGIVIGGTPYGMCYPASKRLHYWEFDVALIDEAAQMSIPLAVAVMSKSDKFIYVGDHKQLDPIIPSGTGLSMFSESIFSRLVKLYPNDTSLLNISYRLNDQLIRIPNTLFYKNQLVSGAGETNSSSEIRSSNYSEVLNHSDNKVLYLHKEFDSQGRSPYEAKIVAELVRDLVSNGVELKDIGILSPYRAQVREIKKALNRTIGDIDTEETEDLIIDTVDRIQGQERDYIIYSMSNSHPLESKRRLDFFYSPNRLNVAITRAMKRCIVIANYKVFDIIDEDLVDLVEYSSLKPSLDIFKEYYRLSSKIEEEAEEDEW